MKFMISCSSMIKKREEIEERRLRRERRDRGVGRRF
jgi:hypothetical protein